MQRPAFIERVKRLWRKGYWRRSEKDSFGSFLKHVVGTTSSRALEKARYWNLARREAERIKKSMPLRELELLALKYAKGDQTRFYAKYLDIDYFLPRDVTRALRLNLHKDNSLEIIDIGTGPGYFPFVCGAYGHHAVGTDLDIEPVFNDMVESLGVKRVIWRIEPFVPAPQLSQRFDLLTCFSVAFTAQGEPWGSDEWRFFLQDLASNVLRDEGKVFFSLNLHDDRNRSISGEVLEMFERNGGVVRGREVSFSSLKAFRTS